MVKNVLFLGAGRMGGAIIKGYLKEASASYQLTILDPCLKQDSATEFENCEIFKSLADLSDDHKFDIIVLAVKPQVFPGIGQEIAGYLEQKGMIVSIMAGIETETITKFVGSIVSIVRCMPNIAAEYGKSVNVAYTGKTTNKKAVADFERIFSASGNICWIESERDMHVTTAISGSGPAYFFAFVEALAKAGSEFGLAPEFALDLAIDTQIGAAELLKENRDPLHLRESVTSKGGTTAAALGEFSVDDKLNAIVKGAVGAAIERSKAL